MTNSRLSYRPANPRTGRGVAIRAGRKARPLLEPMEDRTLLSSGQLDPSFGYQGIVPGDPPPHRLKGYSLIQWKPRLISRKFEVSARRALALIFRPSSVPSSVRSPGSGSS